MHNTNKVCTIDVHVCTIIIIIIITLIASILEVAICTLTSVWVLKLTREWVLAWDTMAQDSLIRESENEIIFSIQKWMQLSLILHFMTVDLICQAHLSICLKPSSVSFWH